MKKLYYTLVGLVFAMTATVAQGVKFEKGNWADIQAKAKAENKYIFVDCHFIGCAPCHQLDKYTLSHPRVGAFFNNKFVNYKVDIHQGEGIAFAKKYKVYSAPTLLYFTPEGKLVHKVGGFRRPKELVVHSKRAFDPNTQFFAMKRKFESGKYDPKFLMSYTTTLHGALEDATKPIETYLNQQDKKNWASQDNWRLIVKYINKVDSPVFAYVFKNKASFEATMDKKKVQKYITSTIENNIRKVTHPKYHQQIKPLKSTLQKLLEQQATPYLNHLSFYQAFANNDGVLLLKYGAKYFDNDSKSIIELCNGVHVLCKYYDKRGGEQYLQKALVWVEKALKLPSRFPPIAATSKKAQVLYRLKRYQEALQAIEKVAEIEKKYGIPSPLTAKLHKQIKAKM